MTTPNKGVHSSGVQELIDRLRDEGVQAGREEATGIVEHARVEAKRLLEDANARARSIIEDANRDAQKTLEEGKRALRSAMRDTVLRFTDQLMNQLRERVERLVGDVLVDRSLLERLVVHLVASPQAIASLDEASELKVDLPATPLGIEELKNDPEALHDRMSQLVRQIAASACRDGISFSAHDGSQLRVVVEEAGLTLDVSPEAVSALLLEHLRPRFRALMQGIIQ